MLTNLSGGTAKILDGRQLAKQILQRIRADYLNLKTDEIPRLDIIKANSEAATAAYIRHKRKALDEIGFKCIVHEPKTINELLNLATKLNSDMSVHGIIVQLPVKLDVPIHSSKLFSLIKPWKDVDCLNPVNLGVLAMTEACPYFCPCTPEAVMSLLDHYGIEVAGKHVCIVGRSAIVGRPLFHMMLRKDATVTLCHSITADLPAHLKIADIVVMAIGQALFLRADWIKPGAVVIDVGINELSTTESTARKLVGDVHFEEVKHVAGAITPVPGGIGPLTVSMLARNLLKAFELQLNEKL